MLHIQHINACHSTRKTWIECFRGVSTKPLNNYLVFHNFINRSKGTVAEKACEFAGRPAIPATA